ncbi:MAG: hypothetical protein IJM89_08055 [Bacteroidales bacterium]|nr:hypothetical protein [Bacteroidales bacterium]
MPSESTQVLDQFFLKLGTLLTMTKDALLEDFLGDLPSYVPDRFIDPSPIKDVEDLKNRLDKTELELSSFIEYVFKRLGYDISNFKESDELFDLFKSVFVTIESIGESVSALAQDGINWDNVKIKADEVKDAKGNKEAKAKLEFDDLFTLTDGDGKDILSYSSGGVSMGLSFGGELGGRIKPLMDLFVNLFKLIKKFRDLEWNKVLDYYKDFGDYLDSTYFNQKFAERVFDHILTVLLRNAKKVFEDEILEITREIQKVKEMAEAAKREVEQAVYDRIKEIRKEIDEIEKQLKDAAEEAATMLKAKYIVLKQELARLMKEVLGPFGKIGDILEKIYQVLDFLGLIGTQTIEVAKYIPDFKIPTPQDEASFLEDVDKKLAAAYEKNKQNFVADANAALKEATQAIRSECPTVQLYVLRWSKVAQMFTSPASYFKEQFPINDYDDAEALVVKIYSLIRAFNPEIPDFSSIGKMINELIARIQKELESSTNEVIKGVKAEVEKFLEFLIDIKKVLETFAVKIRDELTTSFNNFLNGGESLLNTLKSQIKEEVDALMKAASDMANDAKAALIEGTNQLYRTFQCENIPDSLKDILKKVFVDTLVKVVKEKAQEHDLIKDVDPALWESAFNEELDKAQRAANSINLFGEYKMIIADIESHAKEVFSESYWNNGFKNLVKALQDEFYRQTAKIPGSADAWADFGKEKVTKLLQGKSLDNPFSDFDFTAYFSIFTDQIKSFVPSGIDGYYPKFKKATENAIGRLLGAAEDATSEAGKQAKNIAKDVEDYADRVKSFAEDVFISYWSELKDAVYNVVIRPFLTTIERIVKRWIKEYLIPKIIEEVRKAIMANYQTYKDIYNQVKETAEEVQKLYEEAEAKSKEVAETACGILLLADGIADDVQQIDCWMDGIQFALKLYRLIPKSVKEAVKDLIGLPQWDFSGIKLPDYKLDMKNKFLAVTVYKYEKNFSFDIVAFAADRKRKKDGKEEVISGVYVLPVITAHYGTQVALGDSHELAVAASGSLNEGFAGANVNKSEIASKLENGTIGFFFTAPEGFDLPGVIVLASDSAVKAFLEMEFRRQKDKELYIYGYEDDENGNPGKLDDGLLHIKMKNYPQKIFAGYDNGFDVGYLAKMEGLEFKLTMASMNAFFQKILRGDIDLSLDELFLGYSLKKGLTFGGEYNIHIPLKPTIDLDFLKLDNLSLDLGSGGGLHFEGISLSINLNFSVDFDVLTFTFPDLGFGFDFNFLTPDFHFGDFDLSPIFKFPDGLGIGINIPEVVRGAGFVKWDLDKGEFLGGFELTLVEMFGIGALFILNTKMPDGSKGYSFMGALSIFFKPGIQLGLGFSLTGIGASLGLNRRIDTDKIRDSVYDGSLESVMFVKDIQKNLSTIMANMTSFYPVAEDHFFFGAMVQISWAEILNFSCGVFIQVPDLVIAIVGGVHLNIADEVEGLISMNANFMCVFDVHKGISLDASLYDTKLVGIDFHGDIAMRIYWAGDTKGFLLSAGGFHPSYTPEAGFNVPKMKRIGFSFDIGPVAISNESYFAVTSNTVQFGSDSRLSLGWDEFGISGYMYYNVLFQFNPFQFMFDAGIGAAVKMGSLTLLSIDLYLEVSGPAPWHIAGNAKFTIIFTFHVEFSHTWGKKQQISDKKYIDLIPILQDAYDNQDNWNIIRCDVVDGLVATYVPEEGSFVMSPSDTIGFKQEWVPFNQDLEKYGEAYPSDTDRIDVEKVWIQGDQETEYKLTQTSFAPTQFIVMDDAHKLSAPSYKYMDAGFELTAGQDLRNPDEGNPMQFDEKSFIYTTETGNRSDWQKQADKYAKSTASVSKTAAASATPAATTKAAVKEIVKTPKKGVISPLVGPKKVYKIGRASDRSLRKGFDEGFTLRPSSRRNADGFKRYLADLDNMMAQSVRSYIDRLNSTNQPEAK